MVGDVKQSIYRFRLADPTIFLSKYDAYPPLGTQAPGEPRKLLLSQNFRSRAEILEAANDVFSLVMKKRGRGAGLHAGRSARPRRAVPGLARPEGRAALPELSRIGRRKR